MQSNEARLSKELNMEDSLASSLLDDLGLEGNSNVPANHVRSVHQAPLEAGASGTKPEKRYKKPTLADLRQMDNFGSSFKFDASPVRDKAPARTKRDMPSSPLSPPNFNGTHGPRSFSKDPDRDFTGGRHLASPRYPQPTHSHANSPHDRHGDNRTDYDNYGGDNVYGDADSYGQSVPYRDHDLGQHGGDEDPLGWSGEERVIPQLHPEMDPYVSLCAELFA